jgi:ankyrin repeat protein
MTALHLAAHEGSAEVADLLLASGADVDAVDNWGNTALYRAVFAYRGDPGMILLLRRAGANLDHTNLHGVSPRSLAQSIANYDVATWVAETG